MNEPKFTPEFVVKVLAEVGAEQGEMGQYAVNDDGKPMSRSQVCQLLAYRMFAPNAERRMKRAVLKMLEAKVGERHQQAKRARLRLGQIQRMLAAEQ